MEVGIDKIDQKRYIWDLLEVEKINSCHATIFPIKAGLFISIDQTDNDNSANLAVYQWLMEKLIYFIYRTRPNISFVVSLLSQYNLDSRTRHLCVAKQVLCYFKGTINLGIVWGADFIKHYEKYGPMKIISYTDSSYTEDPKDKKLFTGYYLFFSRGIVSWYSRQQ